MVFSVDKVTLETMLSFNCFVYIDYGPHRGDQYNTIVDKNFRHASLVHGVRRIDLSTRECGNQTGFY